MKNKTYLLNTLLAAVFGTYLLVAVVIRTFCPQIILPKANIPNLVLVSLVALVLDHYFAPDAKRCYICIPAFPYAGAFVNPLDALKLAAAGAVVFTVTTLLFTTIQDRLSSGPAAKASAFFSAVSLYMASQCFMGMFL